MLNLLKLKSLARVELPPMPPGVRVLQRLLEKLVGTEASRQILPSWKLKARRRKEPTTLPKRLEKGKRGPLIISELLKYASP